MDPKKLNYFECLPRPKGSTDRAVDHHVRPMTIRECVQTAHSETKADLLKFTSLACTDQPEKAISEKPLRNSENSEKLLSSILLLLLTSRSMILQSKLSRKWIGKLLSTGNSFWLSSQCQGAKGNEEVVGVPHPKTTSASIATKEAIGLMSADQAGEGLGAGASPMEGEDIQDLARQGQDITGQGVKVIPGQGEGGYEIKAGIAT